MGVMMRNDDLVFLNRHHYQSGEVPHKATWWRSRPAHNLQRSNGAGSPCHPRTPPKAAQPKAQIRAAVQTMLTAKRNVGTTCENVERRWRLASAGSWPFALSEIGAKPRTEKYLDASVDRNSIKSGNIDGFQQTPWTIYHFRILACWRPQDCRTPAHDS